MKIVILLLLFFNPALALASGSEQPLLDLTSHWVGYISLAVCRTQLLTGTI